MAQYRKLLLATVYGTLAIVGGACREASVMAPGEAAVAVSEAAGLRKYPENKNHSFTINPGQAVSFRIGDHTISFDAGSVCDKETSTYGPTEWDQPCEPSPKPVNITARASRDSLGNARIDFSPKLRFVPGKDVILELRQHGNWLDNLEVFYCPSGQSPASGKCINEGTWDPELRTKHDRPTGTLKRKIKHFSGYEVAAT